MATPLSELLQDLTPEALLEDFIEIAKALGLSTTAWQPGEPIRAFASIFSRWIPPIWNRQVLRALRAFFLDYAEGEWLTLVAWTFYGVRRKDATFASGPKITVENQEGGFWTINPGDIRFANDSGKTFRNVDGGSLASYGGTGPFPTLELTFVADEAGTASDTEPDEIPVSPTAPTQAPGAGIFLTTPTAGLYGQDEETDEQLKQRCRDSTGPLSPAGPPAAYRYVALSTRRPAENDPEPDRLLFEREGDVAVNVNRAHVVSAGGGVVNVYLASPSGEASGDISTAGTDVYLVNQAIQLLVVPVGITANVASAAEEAQTIDLTVYVLRPTNLTEAYIEATVQTAVETFFQTFPISGRKKPSDSNRYIVMEEIRAVAKASVPGIFNVTSTPSVDEAITANSVVVPTITVTAVLVTQ